MGIGEWGLGGMGRVFSDICLVAIDMSSPPPSTGGVN